MSVLSAALGLSEVTATDSRVCKAGDVYHPGLCRKLPTQPWRTRPWTAKGDLGAPCPPLAWLSSLRLPLHKPLTMPAVSEAPAAHAQRSVVSLGFDRIFPKERTLPSCFHGPQASCPSASPDRPRPGPAARMGRAACTFSSSQ